MRDEKTFSISEVARISGLPASTLRYYEHIGIIRPVPRDMSSKQRAYTQQDIDTIDSLSCLSAIGLPIRDMQTYMRNASLGKDGAEDQIELLRAQSLKLEADKHRLELRERYVALKIQYWKAVQAGDMPTVKCIHDQTHALSRDIKYQDK